MLFSRWLARTTKRTLCSPTSTVPHAILPSHEGPSPPPSPRRSVKDVLTTPRKGCHETEHTPGCAPHSRHLRSSFASFASRMVLRDRTQQAEFSFPSLLCALLHPAGSCGMNGRPAQRDLCPIARPMRNEISLLFEIGRAS